jgi:hypothetical protein
MNICGMQPESPPNRYPSLPWFLNWAVLVLGLPLAALAATHPPNEYKATLGIDALDCQGPFETYIVAIPALLLYGAGLISNGLRWRRPAQLVVALLCLLVSGIIALNVAEALTEAERQRAECELRD